MINLIQKQAQELLQIAGGIPKVSNARVVAGIYKKSRMVSFGCNSYTSSRLQRLYKTNKHQVYQHAEINCIKNAIKHDVDFSRLTMIIVRAKMGDRGKLHYGIAKPCEGCAKAIEAFGLRRVVYSTETGLEWLL